MSDIDWSAIRAEYENGASLRSLAATYHVSKSTIGERKFKEQWDQQKRASKAGRRTPDSLPRPSVSEVPDGESPQAIADQAIADLAKYLSDKEVVDAKLELREHKLFADSFSQYVRAKMLLPSDKPTASGIHADLLPYLSLDQLNELSELEARKEEVLAFARAEKLEAEQGIKTLRKYEAAG